MANRKQINRAFDLRIQQQIVRRYVFAQLSVRGNDIELFSQAADAGKALQIGDDGIRQFIQQHIEGLRDIGFKKEDFDFRQVVFEVGGELGCMTRCHGANQPINR